MKKIFSTTTLALAAFTLLSFFSCARMEEMGNMKVYADDDPVTYDFTLEVENPLVETKATYMPSTLNKITNVNVWIYRDGALLSDYSFYKSDYASDPHLPMMFPSASASYNVYLFANVGQKTAPASEANIGTVSFSVNDYSSFIYNGFPMANSVLNYTPSGGQSISIKRLVGVYNISLAQSSDKITWTVTRGQMKNVPKVVRPFSTLEGFEGYASKIQSALERNESGDLLSTADKTALNNGGSVSLYFLENCQGQLLPGNTDYRLKKLPDNHPAKDFCTYLQLDCSAVTPTATYSNIHYNFYLGEDATTDFSVRRSTQHAFSLELSSDIISTEEEWFIEPEDPIKTGTLCFADTRYTSSTCLNAFRTNTDENEYRRPYRKVNSIYLMKGWMQLYYIYRSDPRITYTIRAEKLSSVDPYVSYELSEVDDNFVAILFSTTKEWPTASAWYEPDAPYTIEYIDGKRAYYEQSYSFSSLPSLNQTTNAKFYIESYDGLLKDSLTVQVLSKKPSLKFTYTNSGFVDNEVYGTFKCSYSNPLGFVFYFAKNITLANSVTYYPNGTISSSQTSTRTVTATSGYISAGSHKYGTYNNGVNTVSSIYYKNNNASTSTSYTGGIGDGTLFCDMFTCGWALTGKNYWTNLAVGSNWYNKHAHATRIDIKLDIQFDSPCWARLIPDFRYTRSYLLPITIHNVAPGIIGKETAEVKPGKDIGIACSYPYREGYDNTTYNFINGGSPGLGLEIYNYWSVNNYISSWGPNMSYNGSTVDTGAVWPELKVLERTDYAPSGNDDRVVLLNNLGFLVNISGSGNTIQGSISYTEGNPITIE